MALVRPLTIARFVDIAGGLLAVIAPDTKLGNDNYVVKLPHLSKRLLYPGTVSKSWLKAVNTLHAFPHALALIAYLLDLVNHIEMPVPVELLYIEKDELACLRRDFLDKCWVRFQDPGPQFQDLTEEYLQNLEVLLGNDEEKIAELQELIKKFETRLEDETEQAACAEETRLLERRSALLGALRAERAGRRATQAEAEAQRGRRRDLQEELKGLDAEIEKINAESQQLKLEVESQAMSVCERTKLLDEVDYALRVQDSKRALAEQIAKMVLSKETELALWQKKTLDSCLEYKQGLIHLSAQFPELASLAIDEKELMGSSCLQLVCSAVEALRGCAAELSARRSQQARHKHALSRKRTALLEETRAKILELKTDVQRATAALQAETGAEAAAAQACSAELLATRDRLQAFADEQRNYDRASQELQYWEKQDQQWRSKLATMFEYIESQRTEYGRLMKAAVERRVRLVSEATATVTDALEQLDQG